jgi:hypothetical protein
LVVDAILQKQPSLAVFSEEFGTVLLQIPAEDAFFGEVASSVEGSCCLLVKLHHLISWDGVNQLSSKE